MGVAMNQRLHRRGPQRRHQTGFGVISALLALVIGSIVAMGTIEGKHAEAQTRSGRLQGDLLNLIKDASNMYAMENYPALQSNLPVSKNGVTLAAGSGVGQSMSPRVEDLVAMGYLMAGTSAQASLVDGGMYQIRLRREPAACVGAACNIPGEVFVDRPVWRPGSTEMNGTAVAALMDRVGGDVLVSLNTNPAQLTAMSGASVANPVGGSPSGVVGARVGFGASGFGRFVVLNDPRDPNFQGNLTVAGTVTAPTIIANTSVGAGTGGAGCRLGEILSSGEILSRTAACVRRAWLDGANGQIGVADAAGTTRGLMDGSTGEITSRDATGAVRAGFRYVGPTSEAFADQFTLSSGGAGIRRTGEVYGPSASFQSVTANFASVSGLALNNTVAIGGACVPDAAMGWVMVGGRWTLARCNGGVWDSAGGSVESAVGVACATNGSGAVTAGGEQLICSGGQYVRPADRFGKRIFAESWDVQDGSVVSKPTCVSGSTGAQIFLLAKNEQQASMYVNRYAVDNGGNWSVYFRDGQSNVVSGSFLAKTYCTYF